ncbi:MAG: lytic transglycosylase domain-containing protein [Angelakisella sp.]
MKNSMKTLGATLLLLVSIAALDVAYLRYYRAAYPIEYSQTVTRASEATGVSTELIYAVIRTESGFQPQARSTMGALGLMQMTPDTLSWVRYRMGEQGATDSQLLFDPEQNIWYGTHTLELLIREFGSVETALAAYHAGWGNVKKWLGDPDCSSDGKQLEMIPFYDTDRYVCKVLSTAEMYKRVYHDLSNIKEETKP